MCQTTSYSSQLVNCNWNNVNADKVHYNKSRIFFPQFTENFEQNDVMITEHV